MHQRHYATPKKIVQVNYKLNCIVNNTVAYEMVEGGHKITPIPLHPLILYYCYNE